MSYLGLASLIIVGLALFCWLLVVLERLLLEILADRAEVKRHRALWRSGKIKKGGRY